MSPEEVVRVVGELRAEVDQLRSDLEQERVAHQATITAWRHATAEIRLLLEKEGKR